MDFRYSPHPHIEHRKTVPPVKVADQLEAAHTVGMRRFPNQPPRRCQLCGLRPKMPGQGAMLCAQCRATPRADRPGIVRYLPARQCENCGKELTVHQKTGNAHYCSKACALAAVRAHPAPPNPKNEWWRRNSPRRRTVDGKRVYIYDKTG